MSEVIHRPGEERLWGWFGLSYASFLTMPRVLMHEMPDEWQAKMTDLLEQYEEAFPNQSHLPNTRVQAVIDGKLVKFPDWVLNYRRPQTKEIDQLRPKKSA